MDSGDILKEELVRSGVLDTEERERNRQPDILLISAW